jgi:hypothetical protein
VQNVKALEGFKTILFLHSEITFSFSSLCKSLFNFLQLLLILERADLLLIAFYGQLIFASGNQIFMPRNLYCGVCKNFVG